MMDKELSDKIKAMRHRFDNHPLIGQKVKLKETESVIRMPHLRMSKKVKSYELDDPEMEAKINALGDNIRIFTPGSGGTMDFVSSRVNVYIEIDGTISGISVG